MIRVVRSLRLFLFDYVFYVFGVTIGSVLRFEEDGVNDEDDSPLLKGSFGSENGGFCGGGAAEPENKVIYSVSPNTSKYHFNAGREIHGFIEEPEIITHVLKEFYVEDPPDEFSGEFLPVEAEKAEVLEKGEPQILSDDGHGDSEEEGEFRSENHNEILAGEEGFREVNFVREAMDEEKWDYFVGGLGAEQQMKHEIEHNNEIDSQFFTNLPEIQVVGEDYSVPSDAESDLISSSDEGRESEKVRETEETSSDSESKIGSNEEVFRDQFCSSDEDYIELEPPFVDSKRLEEEDESENPVQEINMREDEEDEPEILPEHEDVIEQLKRELRTVRTGGLPTIWEEGSESESSIMIQGLKPWKMDQKLERKDQMEEIQKVYNAYEEKMRKLDILNNQTMHAIGFLQIKNQNRPIWSDVKSFVSDNFWSRRSQKFVADSSLKFNGDIHRELELVYVGQICLSWEIMNWQHRKLLALQEHDSKGRGPCITNQVASDFQTFQIFMERFVESDRFHGSRVENYVRNRYVMRRFLQVPAVNGGCLEEKNLTKTKCTNFGGNQAEMMEESMRIFREFIRADKDEGKQAQINLEDPADFNLLNDTRAALQKKEKKLKDIVRSKKCIVKKLHKNRAGRVSKEDTKLVVAEVELKLVSRVLRMSKLTKSQLHWCCQKLNQVVFFKGKVYVEVEPNFLLFPF